MFGVINKVFIGLLIGILNASNHVKYVLLSIRKCMTQTTLINLHPNERSQEFHYYPFAVKLDTCIGSCDTVNGLPNKVYFPKKNRRFKSKRFQDGYWNKWIENINKAYIMRV